MMRMRSRNIVTWACIVPAIVGIQLAVAEVEAPEETFDSPRLAALAKQLTGEVTRDRATIGHFWGEMQGKGPLVEPCADDPHSLWVTFLWLGDGTTQRVNVQGGPPTAESAGWMKVLGHTDLWYRTELVPDDARFVYLFQVNRPLKFSPGDDQQRPLAPPMPDPLNPHAVSSNSSLLELPQAPPQPWLQRVPGVPKGELSAHSIKSEILKQERTFTIHTPPNYDPKDEACRLLVLFDGDLFQHDDQIPGPVILDNLMVGNKIHAVVTVLVNQIDREEELTCSAPYADFTAKELIPWVQSHYNVSAEPTNTIVGGLSLGGLMAAYCGYRHPQAFGNVLSLSGSFWWSPDISEKPAPPNIEPGWLTRQIVAARRLPVRFYLATGRFEHRFPVSPLAENRRFRDVLEAKGCQVKYCEFSGNHDFISWRGPFVEGLLTLDGMQEQK